jgi:hypothetical protein
MRLLETVGCRHGARICAARPASPPALRGQGVGSADRRLCALFSQNCRRASGSGAISALSGVFSRPRRLTGRDFGTLRRIFAPEEADRARFRHSQAFFQQQGAGDAQNGASASCRIAGRFGGGRTPASKDARDRRDCSVGVLAEVRWRAASGETHLASTLKSFHG